MKNKINELVKNFMNNQQSLENKKYYAIGGILALNIFLYPYMKEIYTRYYKNRLDITHIVK